MLKIIPTWVWLVVAITMIGIGYGFGHHAAAVSGEKQISDIRLKNAEAAQHVADLATAASEAARAAEHSQALAFAATAAKYEQEKADANDKAAAVADDLRAGNVRLRQQWRCPATAGDLPQGAASTGQPDGAAELRATGTGSLVRIGALADAQIHGLQQALTACTATTH